MINRELDKATLTEKINAFRTRTIIPYESSETKVNMETLQIFESEESYRELLVSWYQFAPLATDQVYIKKADYIIFAHPYARCENLSRSCLLLFLKIYTEKKPGAKILVCGKAANLEEYLEKEYGLKDLEDVLFFKSNYVREVGKIIGAPIKDEQIIYDDYNKQLDIWPVDGCLQHCGFCRRCYMEIPFESQPLERIKEKLDYIKKTNPEQLTKISLRAENLTEYGLDIYGKQMLPELFKLLNSYEEIESIHIPIGMNIGEISEEILDALDDCPKLKSIPLNFEAGNDRLLKYINKAHTIDKAKYVVQRLRKSNPDLKIISTVMIGLPTETLSDIHDLANLILDVGVDELLINFFIPAEGQKIVLKDVPEGRLKTYHLEELLKCLSNYRFNPKVSEAIERSNDAHPSMLVTCYKESNYAISQKRSFIRSRSKLKTEYPRNNGFFPRHVAKTFSIEYLKMKSELSKITNHQRSSR